ncbi:hypothetical protein FGE12_11620 [Aggregicoccus sp. 17bor-14]|uniref:hypothetical protein n=1 Tax=Myxococcaceae TaxID=31 RepID=UPI00129C4CC8|nr:MULTISPECIES: hypothetical protein [Myxococcaceae]MBF5043036.1 hypothetical protein [Simulacricoccus sp. 17bor-14]MRI88799.1 hypothetical protein [Aggregicoccus sp. 17bor-14]
MKLFFGAIADHQRVGRAPLPFTPLDVSLIDAADCWLEPALVESAFAHALEWGLRHAGLLAAWLRPGHPLYARYRAASEYASCEERQ